MNDFKQCPKCQLPMRTLTVGDRPHEWYCEADDISIDAEGIVHEGGKRNPADAPEPRDGED